MISDAETFWETTKKIEESAGPLSALFFIILFAFLYLGVAFAAAWAVSITLSTPYWMTLISIVLLKFALK